MSNLTNFTDRRFGKLTVIKCLGIFQRTIKPGQGGKTERRWLCRCDCGRESVIATRSLKKTIQCRSCVNRTHGKSASDEFDVWAGMIDRCYYERTRGYEDYGGRGIIVCERWRGSNGFINFLADMGPRPSPEHSIDRFPNNDGNYEPGNVRWATRKENGRNKRNNRLLTFNGKTACASEWAEITGIPLARIYYRLNAGWSHEDILHH